MGEFTSGFFMGDQATNGRVLVVDDEADIRKVVRMTLQKAGYDVLEAENGEKAIETINSGENRLLLDILICDIRMPKINGVEAIAYFRANYPRVPVIVLTGFPDADMATSMLRQGVVDYLVKPVEGEKLRESVARAMEQTRARASLDLSHGYDVGEGRGPPLPSPEPCRATSDGQNGGRQSLRKPKSRSSEAGEEEPLSSISCILIPSIEIVGISDRDPAAPGLLRAKNLHIP